MGDWRLFFADRDATAKVTPDAVNTAAATYFVRDNRVVGLFIPDDHPKRAPYMTTPDVKDVIAKATFKEEGDQAEAFDASQDNIDARTERLRIGGVEVALLPKKTRGRTVTVLSNFQWGNLESNRGKAALNSMVLPMLSRGAEGMDRKAIADACTELKVQGDVMGYTTTADNLVATIELFGKLFEKSTFPTKEVNQLVKQMTTMMEAKSDDPVYMAREALKKHFQTYPAGDPRNTVLNEDLIKGLKSLTREELYDWYKTAVSAEHGAIAIVGEFDPAAVKAALEKLYGNAKKVDAKYAYERYFGEYKPVSAERIVIDAPSKENAVIVARVDFAASVNDEDAAALVVADWILGGGTGLSNRLVDRLRQKEGLSYGVGSHVKLPQFGNRSSWMMSAIVAPQNLPKAEACAKEEIERAVKEGFTDQEVKEAIKGILDSRAVNRAQDDYLAQSWLQFMEAGKTFAFSKQFEERIAAVTVDSVNAALRRMVVPENVTWILSGDLAKAGIKK